MTAALTRIARLAVVLGLLLAAVGCAGGSRPGTVTIMVPWSGAEFAAFYEVVKDFEAASGVHVDVEVTRATTQQLDAAVAAGDPPDLAVLPSVGAVGRYAERLRPLKVDRTAYVQPFRDLMTAHGKVRAVPVKADVKSLVWYDPAHRGSAPPGSLDALTALSAGSPRTWCLGLSSGPTSGWPGADWIADILLARHGPGVYQDWLTGRTPRWSSADVRAAWAEWARMVGPDQRTALVTEFGKAAEGMTGSAPTCTLSHGALSAMGFASSLRPGADYDFVPFSTTRLLQVSADFVGMFARDNPSATALIDYLSGRTAQTRWVGHRGGYALSADSQVPLSAYPAGVERRVAAMLRPHSGYTLCFSAADVMQPDVSAAFYRGVVDYLDDRGSLAQVLSGLDTVQRSADPVDDLANRICATPG
jgi:alpha-glucoside transport system substrate-binding protein